MGQRPSVFFCLVVEGVILVFDNDTAAFQEEQNRLQQKQLAELDRLQQQPPTAAGVAAVSPAELPKQSLPEPSQSGHAVIAR